MFINKKQQRTDILSAVRVFQTSALLNTFVVIASQSPSIIAGQDEIGYFAKAYAIIGSPIGFPSKYSSGSAFFYAPVAYITETFGSQYAGWITLIIINSILLALSFFFAQKCVLLIDQIRLSAQSTNDGQGRTSSELLWLAPILYTPVMLAVSTTLATIPLTFSSVAYLYFILNHLAKGEQRSLNGAAAFGLLAALIHPTAILLGIIAVLISAPILFCRTTNFSTKMLPFTASIIAPLVGFSVDRLWLTPFLNDQTGGVEANLASTYGDTTEQLISYVERFLKAPFSPAFYLMLATTFLMYWCLTGFVTFSFWRTSGSQRGSYWPRRPSLGQGNIRNRCPSTLVSKSTAGSRINRVSRSIVANYQFYFGLIIVGTVLISFTAIRYMTERRRIDDWFYLRYSDPFLFISVISVVSLALKKVTALGRLRVASLATLMAIIPFLTDARLPGPQDEFFYYNNAAYWPHVFGIRDLWLGLSLFLVSGVTFIAFRFGRQILLFSLLLLAVASSVVYRSNQSTGHSRRSNLTEIAAELANGGCTAFDVNVPVRYQDLMGRLGLDQYRLERASYLVFDMPSLKRRIGISEDCQDLIISYDMEIRGRLIARDLFGGQGLFARDPYSAHSLENLTLVNLGPGLTLLADSMNSEACLRRGCFALPGDAALTSQGKPGTLNDGSVIYGPYANVDEGEWEIRILLDVPDPAGIVIGTNAVVASQRDDRVVKVNWSRVDGKWLGKAWLTLNQPAALFEIVVYASAWTSYGAVERVSFMPLN